MARILYLAKHAQHFSNDDEGGIAYALVKLGHEVVRIPEADAGEERYRRLEGNLLLYHHFEPTDILKTQWMCTPKVFWYFDLVEWDDPTLEVRNNHRRQWMERNLPIAALGFCTDGDWVARATSGGNAVLRKYDYKLVWLPQGADERTAGKHSYQGTERLRPTVLFTGIGHRGGKGRETWLKEVSLRLGWRLRWIERKIHGLALAQLINGAKIVLAPDSPVGQRYWSNRVFLTLGFGGFLLHPRSAALERNYYTLGVDYIPYNSRDEMFELIDQYLRDEYTERRDEIAASGLKTTLAHNLYRHRCEILLATVKARLGVG